MDSQERRDVETLTKTLENVVLTTDRAFFQKKSTRKFDREFDNCSCDEVFPNIFLGGMDAAKNKKFLKKLGVTHVVNAAMGDAIGMVNTSANYYTDVRMEFIGFRMMDMPFVDISKYFQESSNFIENALASGGKVYVHCVMGISRSTTLVCAFLMMKRGFSAVDALSHVRARRLVHPNEGFLERLASLDMKLRRERGGDLGAE